MPPLYTPASANAALPYVRRVVSDLVRDHAAWRASTAAVAALAPTADPGEAAALRRRASQLADDVRSALAELSALGVECKGLDVGLVDFPAVVDGAPAYLCWQLGEPAVAWWHRRDAGFAGRRLLTAAQGAELPPGTPPGTPPGPSKPAPEVPA